MKLTNQSTNGILYVAVGNRKYLNEAHISMRSLKTHTDNLQFALCTNLTLTESEKENWQHIIPYDSSIKLSPSNFMHPKLFAMTNSPFDNTLYLDTDTFILGILTPIFTLLKKFDFLYCSSHMAIEKDQIARGKRKAKNGEHYQIIDDTLPVSFDAIQGGLFAFNNLENTKTFLMNCLDTYIKEGFYDDQSIIRREMWNSDIRIFKLTQAYNFNSLLQVSLWKMDNFLNQQPLVWHYTLHKHLSEKGLNQVAKIFTTSTSIPELVFKYIIFKIKRKLS